MEICKTHYIDNQGCCHTCGKPLDFYDHNTFYSQAAWNDLVAKWNTKHPKDKVDYVFSRALN